MSKYLEDEQFLKYFSKKEECCKCCKCCNTIDKRMDYIIELLEQLFNKK